MYAQIIQQHDVPGSESRPEDPTHDHVKNVRVDRSLDTQRGHPPLEA
jgi:hypothetical protein